MKITYSNEVLDAYSGQINCEAGIFVDGEIVGVAQYVLYDDELTISDIFVRPEFRRQGFGSRLMKYIQRENPDYHYKPSLKTELGAKFVHKELGLDEGMSDILKGKSHEEAWAQLPWQVKDFWEKLKKDFPTYNDLRTPPISKIFESAQIQGMSQEEVQRAEEAYNILVEKLQKGEQIDEGMLGSIVGGGLGLLTGPAIGKAICSVLGIKEEGPLGKLLTSRLVTTAMGIALGK